MKMPKFFFTIALALLPSAYLSANTIGNGGGAIVCEQQNQVKRVYAYDLFEAQTRGAVIYKMTDTSVQFNQVFSEIMKRLKKFSPLFALDFEHHFIRIHNDFTRQENDPNKVHLSVETVQDFRALLLPESCPGEDSKKKYKISFKTVANYVDDIAHEVFLNVAYYQKMSPPNKVAFLAHETIYYLARQYNQLYADNTLVRQAVWSVFLEKYHQNALKQLFGEDYIKGTDLNSYEQRILTFKAEKVYQMLNLPGFREITLSSFSLFTKRPDILANVSFKHDLFSFCASDSFCTRTLEEEKGPLSRQFFNYLEEVNKGEYLNFNPTLCRQFIDQQKVIPETFQQGCISFWANLIIEQSNNFAGPFSRYLLLFPEEQQDTMTRKISKIIFEQVRYSNAN
jgi:hypothetical protein